MCSVGKVESNVTNVLVCAHCYERAVVEARRIVREIIDRCSNVVHGQGGDTGE